MKHQDQTGIIPDQYTGKEIEAEASVTLENVDAAKRFFGLAKDRLLQVNGWHAIAGKASASFQVVDSAGDKVDRMVQAGDYLRVDIPGPGSKEGDGYDWVRVEDLKEAADEDRQSIGFRVRPCENPFTPKDETAHFYSEESTSSFMVLREGSRVSAWIVDHNTKPNNQADSITDKIRNIAVGVTAVGSFSKLHWQQLADGLISDKK